MKKAEMEKKLKVYEDFVNTLERITSAQLSDVKKTGFRRDSAGRHCRLQRRKFLSSMRWHNIRQHIWIA